MVSYPQTVRAKENPKVSHDGGSQVGTSEIANQ